MEKMAVFKGCKTRVKLQRNGGVHPPTLALGGNSMTRMLMLGPHWWPQCVSHHDLPGMMP